MPQDVGDKLRKKLEANGVTVMCGETVTSLSPKDFEKEKVCVYIYMYIRVAEKRRNRYVI